MSSQNQKHEKQPEQRPSEQPTAPAKPVELTDEQLEQVTGGFEPNGPTALPDLDGGATIRDPGL